MEGNFQRRSGIMTADMGGKTVMMDVMSGKYYNLGAVGGRIWELLSVPMSFEELIGLLMQEYDVSREQCIADVEPFLEKMLERGILLRV